MTPTRSCWHIGSLHGSEPRLKRALCRQARRAARREGRDECRSALVAARSTGALDLVGAVAPSSHVRVTLTDGGDR